MEFDHKARRKWPTSAISPPEHVGTITLCFRDKLQLLWLCRPYVHIETSALLNIAAERTETSPTHGIRPHISPKVTHYLHFVHWTRWYNNIIIPGKVAASMTVLPICSYRDLRIIKHRCGANRNESNSWNSTTHLAKNDPLSPFCPLNTLVQ